MAVTRKVVILGTGGTIAGIGHAQGGGLGYQAGQIEVAQLLTPLLQGGSMAGVALEAEQVAQLDSKDMDVSTWRKLAAARRRWLSKEEVAALVITHGTDTLEETAWFLQCVLQPHKPVVMTCAMRPATALSADGPGNLRDALAAAVQSAAGVWVVAAGEMHSAQWVRKVHPYRVHAFASAAYGPAGWIEEGRLRWASGHAQSMQLATLALESAVQRIAEDAWPWVEVVCSAAAARPQVVDALVAAGVQGLVVAATGNGSVHQALLPVLQRAQDQGVVVWRTTKCEQGHIVQADGVQDPAVSELSPAKARISLMLQLLERSAG